LDPSHIEKSPYLKILYEKSEAGSTVSFVLLLITTVTVLFILKNIFLFLINRMQTKTAFNLVFRISLGKYSSFLGKTYHFHSESNVALLLRNFVQLPTELISYSVLPFFSIINELFILFLVVAGIAFYDSLLFSAILLFSIPFFVIYTQTYKKRQKIISEQSNIAHAGMYRMGMQSMEGFREIVVFGKKNFFKKTFEEHLKIFSKLSGDIYLMNVFSPKIVETGAVICIFCIFMFGYLFHKNLNSLAQFLIIFSIAAYRIIPSINKLILSLNYIKTSTYLFQYFEKADFVPESPAEKAPAAPKEKLIFKRDISIRDLRFKFPGHDKHVLNNINLTIPRNKTIGITGPSGSG
ncbi:MAG: ABC transporter transmembrane domain-containing protein, partial [Bacteroidia bacterium]